MTQVQRVNGGYSFGKLGDVAVRDVEVALYIPPHRPVKMTISAS